MKEHQQKAWDMLTDLERNSLYLQMSQGQSSWEAGEILGVSHYKYLELRERSVKFFKMFSEYFEKYTSLFRADSPCESRFIDYIEACIEKRMQRKDAIRYSGDSTQLLTELRRRVIIRNMDRLKKSENQQDRDLYFMIMEYDRWNNSRIMPRSIQQMSAYKRRNNKREKIYINYVYRIPDWKIEALINCYQFKPKKSPAYYVALFSKELFPEGYQIIKIKRDKETVKKLTDLYIYVFENEGLADAFGYMLSSYFEKTQGPKLGMKFWQEYRDTLQFAINYKEVNNIDFYADRLDMAYELPAKAKKAKLKKKTQKASKRANPEIFYKR